jgi:hypothetical protein
MNGWDDLIAECRAMEAWYGRRWPVSAYIGVDKDSRFFGGCHVDGERLSEEVDGYAVDAEGDTFEGCVGDLIRQMREYRAKIDAERAEDEA